MMPPAENYAHTGTGGEYVFDERQHTTRPRRDDPRRGLVAIM